MDRGWIRREDSRSMLESDGKPIEKRSIVWEEDYG